MSHNCLTRFIFDEMPIRGLHVHLQEAWQQILANTQHPPRIQQALGELLTAANLLAANLKFSGSLILQIQGKGAIQLLVAEATSAGTCRASARLRENIPWSNTASLPQLLGEGGIFVMTLQADNAEPWQGVVALEGENIAQMLMNYMRQSEQLDTQLFLHATDQKLGGLLLQRLPESASSEDDWQHISTLAQTIKPEELVDCDVQTLLYRLYHQTPPRLLSNTPLTFSCTCSREKVGNMLLLLGAQEAAESLREMGSIDVHCDFCRAHYVFDEEDVNALFQVADIQAATPRILQ